MSLRNYLLILLCLSILILIPLTSYSDSFLNTDISDNDGQVYYYNPGNPAYYHLDAECSFFGDLYLPMISISEVNPLFEYMKPCPSCIFTTTEKEERFLPWLWSIEEKHKIMPEDYDIPNETCISILDATASAFNWIEENGDSPYKYAVYTDYHHGNSNRESCYRIVCAIPRIETDINNTLFFDMAYEIYVSPLSGEIIEINQGH